MKKNNLITVTLIALVALAVGFYIGDKNIINTNLSSSSETDIALPEEVINIEIPTTEKSAEEDLTEISLVGLNIIVPELEINTTITQEETDNGIFLIGNSESGSVTLIENQLKSVNNDTYVIPMAIDNGGSGTFLYLATVTKTNNESEELSLSHTDSDFIGDRVGFESMNTKDNITTVSVLDRYDGQAMSEEPTNVVVYTFASMDKQTNLISIYSNVNESNIDIDIEPTPSDVWPIKVTGYVPAGWAFEGDFPISVIDNDEVIYEHYGTIVDPLTGEFSANLNPDEDITISDSSRFLLIKRDNVSDDRSLDAFVQLSF